MPPAAPPAAAGVGITFRQLAEGGFVVVKVASGGPSDRQGVQPGDILTKVDRQEVLQFSFERLAHLLAGPFGSVVSLTFVRKRLPGHDDNELQYYSIDVARGTASLSVDPAFSSNSFASPRGDHAHAASLSGHEQHHVVIPRKMYAGGGGNTNADKDAGIGVVISNAFDHPHYSGGYHMIVSLDATGSAAQTGKIQVGDIIRSVNGEEMWGKSLAEYTDRLKGPNGSTVEVGVLRPTAHAAAASQSGSGGRASSRHNGIAVPGSGTDAHHMRSEGKGKRKDEVRRVVVSAVDQEQLARKIRVVHIHRLGGFTPVDGVLIWIIHSLVATAIILFLVQTNVLPMDWDLRPFFHEQRVVSSQVVEGGFFFAFAPMCVLTVMFLFASLLFAITAYRMGGTQASLIFSQRPVLVCISVYGNVFLDGSLLLLFLDLSRLECCDFVHKFEYASLVIMAPVTCGVVLFWAWFWAIEFIMIRKEAEQRKMRSEFFTRASACMWLSLTLAFFAAEAMVSLKVEGELEDVNWLIACIPVHVFFGVIFISSVVSFCSGPVWLHPTSRKVLAFIGMLDSLAFEAILVIVLLKLDHPDLKIWENTTFALALSMPSFTFLLMVMHIANSWNKKPAAPEVTWLQPRVLEFHRARNADKVSAKVCWASPGGLENFPPCTEFCLEISNAGAAKLASDQGADLGIPAPAEGYSARTQAWKEVLSTEDQFARLGNLEPSCRYLLRLTYVSRDARRAWRSFTRQGPLTLIETPDWPIASLEDIILTTTPPPNHEAAAAPSAQRIISPIALASPSQQTHAASNSVIAPGRSGFKSASRVPKTIPGPLFLKELTPSGGDACFLCGVFEWLPQTHFDANILDLQLIEAGDGSEPHDYVMVFAGSELQVRVHNILPASSYRVRLRAGDLVDGEISTAVERATLPLNTPTWQEVLETTSRGNAEAEFAPPAAAPRPGVGSGHPQANVIYAPYPHDRTPSTTTTAMRTLRPEEPSISLFSPQRPTPHGQGPGVPSSRPVVLPASAYPATAPYQYLALA